MGHAPAAAGGGASGGMVGGKGVKRASEPPEEPRRLPNPTQSPTHVTLTLTKRDRKMECSIRRSILVWWELAGVLRVLDFLCTVHVHFFTTMVTLCHSSRAEPSRTASVSRIADAFARACVSTRPARRPKMDSKSERRGATSAPTSPWATSW